MKIYLSTLTFLLISYLNSFSQDRDYIVKSNNDTIYGEISMPFPPTQLTIKDSTYRLNDGSLKSYFREGKTYLPVILPGRTQLLWVNCLVDGKIKLYEVESQGLSVGALLGGGINGGYHYSINWYVQKDSFNVLDISFAIMSLDVNRKDRNELLGSLFADNPQVFKEYNEIKSYRIEAIQEIVKSYNSQARAKGTSDN